MSSKPTHSVTTFQPVVEEIIAQTSHYLNPAEQDQIRRAYEFAYDAHKNQTRFSGDPYITHPLAAVRILLPMEPDLTTIMACLLHDVPENTEFTLDDIKKNFGSEVCALVSGIVDLSTIYYRNSEEKEQLKQLFLALVKDIRIVFIKLSERLHNILTLHFVPSKEKQQRIAEETLFVYAPIANRLGLDRLKTELEDACFRFLNPTAYRMIKQFLVEEGNVQQQLLQEAVQKIKERLLQQDIHAEIYGRIKSPYSIYSKMRRKGTLDISDIKDLIAVRVIVSKRGTCYRTLGVIHQYWTPITSRIKDYIARPKPNNYQSIHTVIQGIHDNNPEQLLEVQIRSRKMHAEAEYGSAAYALYKERGKSTPGSKERWVSELRSTYESSPNSLKFFEGQIFVLTPEGEIIILPSGATPVDFAYEISPTLGDTCIAAKINGRKVPLDYNLHTGEYVEILTSQEKQPNTTWLSFVKTQKAKDQIKKYLKSQNNDDLVKEGLGLLNDFLKKHNLPPASKDLQILSHLLPRQKDSIEARKNILIQISTHEVKLSHIIKELKKLAESKKKKAPQKKHDIIIDDEKNIPYKIAQCCTPHSGNEIVGYTTRGKHISIHRSSCHILKKLDTSRLLNAHWAS